MNVDDAFSEVDFGASTATINVWVPELLRDIVLQQKSYEELDDKRLFDFPNLQVYEFNASGFADDVNDNTYEALLSTA